MDFLWEIQCISLPVGTWNKFLGDSSVRGLSFTLSGVGFPFQPPQGAFPGNFSEVCTY